MATEIDELITKLSYADNSKVLDEADKRVTSLAKSNETAAKTTDSLTEQQLELGEQLQDTQAQTKKLVREQKQLQTQVKKAGKATDEETKQLARLDKQIDGSRMATERLQTQSRKLGNQKKRVGLEAKKLSRDQRKLAAATRKAKDALREEGRAASSTAGKLDAVKDSAAGVAKGQLAADAIKTGAALLFEAGREVITVGTEFESLRARLKTVEGSAEGAAQAFSLIQDFASTTPFQLQDTTNAFIRLKNLGLDASTSSLSAFGNIAAAQGKPMIEFIEAVADASTNEFERLKEFGIKASKQGEDVAFTFKGTTTTVGANAKEIQGFLKGLGETEFAGAMADQMNTTAGAVSNFRDRLAQATDQIAQQGPLEEFNKILVVLSESIGGEGGLGTLIADVLTTALRTVRELFEAVPQGAVIEFFQRVIDLVSLMVGELTNAAGEGSGFISVIMETGATIIDVAVKLGTFIGRIQEIGDKLPGVTTLLKLLLAGIKLLLIPFELFADLITKVLELLDPLLSKLESLASTIPSLSDIFGGLKGAIFGVTAGVAGLNSELEQTASIAGEALAQIEKLKNAQKIENQSDAELTRRLQEGTAAERAEAEKEVRKRVAKRERDETGTAASKETREAGRTKALGKFEKDIKGQSVKALTALTQDGSVPEKLRDKATKELARRRKKGAKAGKAERKNLLTSQIAKQIDERANEAGERAAARALIRARRAGTTVGNDAVNSIQREERDRVKKQLTTRFAETGELPAGIRSDISQIARTPGIEAAGGRVAPPVISIQNFKITGTTITIETNVASSGSSAQQIAMANVTAFRSLSTRDVGEAIANRSTQERR